MDRTFDTHIIAASTCGNHGHPGDDYEVINLKIARFDDGLFEGRLLYEKGRNQGYHDTSTEKSFRCRGNSARDVCNELNVYAFRCCLRLNASDVRGCTLDLQYKADDQVEQMASAAEKPASRVWIAATIVDGSPEVTAHKTEVDGWQNIWDEFCVKFWEREVGTPAPTSVGGSVAQLVGEYFEASANNGKSEECFVVAVDLPL